MWVTCTEVNLNLPKSQTQRALCLAVAPPHLLPPWPQVGAGACSCLSSGGFSFPGTERKASPQDPDLRDRQTALVCPRLKGRGRLIMNLSFLQIHVGRGASAQGELGKHTLSPLRSCPPTHLFLLPPPISLSCSPPISPFLHLPTYT